MQPIRKAIPSSSDTRQDAFVCTEYSVGLATQRVVAAMHVEQFHRTATPIQEVLEDGTSGPNGWTEYGEWEPYRRYHPSGQYPVHVSTDNSKWVDAQFNLVEAGTPGAMGEVDMLWYALENKLVTQTQVIEMLMDRMISRGNLEDLSQL